MCSNVYSLRGPTAYNDALPSVTVDVMNVWDEKLPGV